MTAVGLYTRAALLDTMIADPSFCAPIIAGAPYADGVVSSMDRDGFVNREEQAKQFGLKYEQDCLREKPTIFHYRQEPRRAMRGFIEAHPRYTFLGTYSPALLPWMARMQTPPSESLKERADRIEALTKAMPALDTIRLTDLIQIFGALLVVEQARNILNSIFAGTFSKQNPLIKSYPVGREQDWETLGLRHGYGGTSIQNSYSYAPHTGGSYDYTLINLLSVAARVTLSRDHKFDFRRHGIEIFPLRTGQRFLETQDVDDPYDGVRFALNFPHSENATQDPSQQMTLFEFLVHLGLPVTGFSKA